jgi:hypothetical protein
MPYRCDCGTVLDLIALLDRLPGDGTSASRMIGTRCTGCDAPMELRLGNGRFDVGYSYFGGSMHFEPVKEVSVPGLHVTPGAPDDLDVILGTRHWHFSVRTTSRQRFLVFDRAFAAGKRLDALDFAQWGVGVEAVEREEKRMEPAGDLTVIAGDFLHLAVPAPALTSAWYYLNGGHTDGA